VLVALILAAILDLALAGFLVAFVPPAVGGVFPGAVRARVVL
jgi:hypothetical protein